MASEAPAPGRACPHCRELNDDQTAMEQDAEPRDGDWSVCAYCGGLSVFTGGGQRLRLMTDFEMGSITRENWLVITRARTISRLARLVSRNLQQRRN